MRSIKNKVWAFLKCVVGRKKYEIIRAKYNLGYVPNIKTPQTFNEKIMFKKIYGDTDYCIDLADKFEVRDFVKNRVGEEYLNEVFFVGNDLKEVDWNNLPQRFVIKTTQGGGGEGNVFVHNKEDMNLDDVISQTHVNLLKRFGSFTNEDWYLKIDPRVIIEELMLDQTGTIPSDYKFFCFHGKCHYIQVDSDRFGSHARTFYNTKWEYQDFSLLFPRGEEVNKPSNFDDMLNIAERLAQDFDFVRVDLYSLNNTVRFGELTFSPGSGWEPFEPKSMDAQLGELW